MPDTFVLKILNARFLLVMRHFQIVVLLQLCKDLNVLPPLLWVSDEGKVAYW